MLTSGVQRTSGSLPVPAEPNGDCSRELLTALDQRDVGAVKDLIARGAVAVCSKTAGRIEQAIENDRIEDLKLLLGAGTDPNVGSGEFPAHRARWRWLSKGTHLAAGAWRLRAYC